MKFSGKLESIDEKTSQNGKKFWVAKFDNAEKNFSVWSETIAEELIHLKGQDVGFEYITKGKYNNIVSLGYDEPTEIVVNEGETVIPKYEDKSRMIRMLALLKVAGNIATLESSQITVGEVFDKAEALDKEGNKRGYW